ncbi:MAG: hypothetical protein GX542_00235 [Rhodococcus sp.]|nr:hypothetical protein [Rhodococcus sp. (in: high G+C Gram-positive bacteria)]
MDLDLRSVVASLAAVASGGLASFVLTNPRTHAWAIMASEREVDRWVDSQPVAIAVGVVVAVAVAGLLGRYGTRRMAWVLAAIAVAVICGAVAIVKDIGSVDALIATNTVKTVAAGVLLGSAIAALASLLPRLALVLGILMGFATASVGVAARSSESIGLLQETTSAAGEPPWWLLIAAVVLCVICAGLGTTHLHHHYHATETPGPDTSDAATAEDGSVMRDDNTELLIALAVAIGIAVLHRVLASWVDGYAFGGGIGPWVSVFVSLLLIGIVVIVAAKALGYANGRLILATTGIAAAAAIMFQDLRHPLAEASTGLVLLVITLAAAVGLAFAARWDRPEWGLLVVALIPLVAAIAPEFGTGGFLLYLRLAVFGVGAGFAMGAALPPFSSATALGLGLPFIAFLFPAIAVSTRTLAGPDAIRYAPDTDLIAVPHFDDSWGTYLGAASLLAVVLFCAAGLARRSPIEPDAHENDADPAHPSPNPEPNQ